VEALRKSDRKNRKDMAANLNDCQITYIGLARTNKSYKMGEPLTSAIMINSFDTLLSKLEA
jgi:hypothetical protein